MAIQAIIGSAALGTTVSSIANALLGPKLDRISYDAYRNDMTRLPDPHAILSAHNAGLISKKATASLLANFGCKWTPIDNESLLDERSWAWTVVSRMMLKVPSPETVLQGLTHHLLDNDTADILVRRAGADERQWDWVKNLSYSVPSPELATSAYAREAIDTGRWNSMVQRAGGHEGKWVNAIPAYYSAPSISEALSLRNRQIIDDDGMDRLLRRNGLGIESERNLIKRLRFTIPSISDLITMQVREAFDPVLANALQLYDEAPKDIIPYLEAQGLNWPVEKPGGAGFFTGNVDGVERNLNWPDMYWAMHWRPISPEQAFRMYHLLRPERIKRYTDRGMDVKEFSLTDLRRWLRIQDFPKGVRDYVAAINFTPLRLVDIRAAIRLDVAATAQAREGGVADPPPGPDRDAFTRSWAINQFLDRGVHRQDAETQVDIVLAQERARRTAAVRNMTANTLARFLKNTVEEYRTGILDRTRAENVLRAAGLDDGAIKLALDTVDFEVKRTNTTAAIRLVRSRYMDGIITINGAQAELAQIGVVPNRSSDYLQHWTVLRSGRHRLATTAKIQQLAREGLLTPQDARDRLDNLGWSNADILLLLQEVQIAVNKTAVAQVQAAQRAAKAQARELERLARLVQQQLENIRANLRRISPMPKLQKWLKEGLISSAFFESRASAMGYPPNEIILHEQEALLNGQPGATPPAPAP